MTTVLSTPEIELDPETVLIAQFLGRRRSFSAALRESARQAVALGQQLLQPAAIYDEFPVLGRQGEDLIIEAQGQPKELRIGPKIDLLDPAERVMISVDTIGPALGAKVRNLQESNDTLAAYMLDSVGVVALGAVGEILRREAEERAAELTVGVSAALAPGSLVGWPIAGQRDLCSLLPLERIGVELSHSSVLKPHKSASMLIGLGPNYASKRVGSVCRYCSLADSCWRWRG